MGLTAAQTYYYVFETKQLADDFGPGRQLKVSRRSRNTNPSEERVRISQDIRNSRGRFS